MFQHWNPINIFVVDLKINVIQIIKYQYRKTHSVNNQKNYAFHTLLIFWIKIFEFIKYKSSF
jgi:hypothetical protein